MPEGLSREEVEALHDAQIERFSRKTVYELLKRSF